LAIADAIDQAPDLVPIRVLRIAYRLACWRPGEYLRASGGLFGWLLLRAVGQAVLVIALARLLGATGYGQFITILAVASLFAPLAGLGVQGVLLRDGARNPRGLPGQLCTALRLWWLSTAVFGTIGVAAALVVVPHDAQGAAVAALVLAEVGSSSLMEIVARSQQSQQRTQRFGAILAGLVLARLTALVVYAMLARPEVNGWMWAYAVGSLAYTAWLILRTQRDLLSSRPPCAPLWPLVREGLPFAVASLSLRLQAEFNKPVLAQLGFALAGNFSAAQRAVDIASLPLVAMQEALWARLYASADYQRRMLVTAAFLLLFALLGGVVLYLVAPLLPLLLGPGFEQTVHLLQLLALLPMVQLVRNFGGFKVMASGNTRTLGHAYFIGSVVSIITTLALVRYYGLSGAVTAAYISEIAIIFILFSWGSNDEV
jgi:O-antigen/teichoic acid export membrane protein